MDTIKSVDYKTASKVLSEVSQELLSKMQIQASVEVTTDEENELLLATIDSPEAGLLIGSRGRTLNSIQTILGNIVKSRMDGWVRVSVDVANWREKEADRLQELADQAAERAVETGEPQHLYNLTPAQRRIVHSALSENDKITSHSEGEGKERFLIIEKA